MIAIVDIGNTNITIGLFWDGRIVKVERIDTSLSENIPVFSKKLQLIIKKNDVKDAFIGSVVPKVTQIIKKILSEYCRINPLSIDKRTKLNIKNRYKNKYEVGDDRIANAAAAAYYYKNRDVIVIDFGTAITFDVINRKAEYLGGLILPGINLCLKCLVSYTAKLPEVKIKDIKKIIGDNTEKSIISGIKNGFTGAANYILKKIKKELNVEKPKIILTGGETNLIKINIANNQTLDKNFTLKGFKIIYDLNKKK